MRLLFITNSRIGDAVLSTGVLDYLIRHHPGLRVTVATGPVAAPLFLGVPGLEHLHALPKQPWAGHWRHLWTQVVGTRWDWLVDLRRSPMPWLLRADRRLRPTGDSNAPIHRVRRAGAMLGADGFTNPPAPRLWTRPEDEAAATAAVGPETDGRPLLVLAPTANWIAKTWPPERFVATARALTGPGAVLEGARIGIVAAPQERPAVRPVLEGLADRAPLDLVGRLDLLGIQAVLSRARLFIGNDSGLMHMAAAAGAPTVGLFGPSRDDHYAPWGPLARAVRTDEPYEVLFPPGLITSEARNSRMTGLPVSRVIDAANALLREQEHTSGTDRIADH